MIRPDPLDETDLTLADLKARWRRATPVELVPPPDPNPPVDVAGYLGATAQRYECPLHGTVWGRPWVPPCDCDPYLDADP